MIARIAKKGIREHMTTSELAIMMNNSLTEMMKIMNKGFESVRIDMDKGFEAVDQKFTAMGIRLNRIEQRLDKVESRLDDLEDGQGLIGDRLENIEKNTVSRFEFDAFVIKTGR